MNYPHVFISYKHEEHSLQLVEEIYHRLTRLSYEVWYDVQITGGMDWRAEIDRKIEACFALLVIITPASNSSDYVIYEWAYALGLGKKVIPVLFDGLPNDMHPRLATLHYRDFRSRNARQWEALIKDLEKEEKAANRRRNDSQTPDAKGAVERIANYFRADEPNLPEHSYLTATDVQMLRRFMDLAPRKLFEHLRPTDLLSGDIEHNSGNLTLLSRIFKIKDFAEIRLMDTMDDKHLAQLLLNVCDTILYFERNQHDTPVDELFDPSDIDSGQRALRALHNAYDELLGYIKKQYPTFGS